ncbi:MAG: type IV pilus twitching motility protein PilT [Candidatus Dojkabacteria bacterium]|nr:MAG: type IV pilus twitching motility protein PilT [Candidatus Dojkabacteria bacterium]
MPGAYDTKTLLNLVVEKDASDLHLAVGYQPMIRIDGSLVTVGDTILDPKTAKELIYSILPDDKKEQLEVNREVDLAYQHEGAGRFRINAYWQRGYISAAFRLIPTRIRTIQELKLPDLFHKFSDMEQGLVLVTGPTGHGKSTTLAAVIQEINMKHPKHILTIEDPIEYVFPQQKALVSQRELGDDTHSWKGALRSALREDPDVVLVGEMRDLETISAAITVAETGHLVFATLHTNSAAQTIQRIVNMYPDVQQEEIRTELADVLEAVVAQRLIPIKGGGRRAALEIMLMTPAIRNLIRENKIYQIDNIIRTSVDIGMITLEKSLLGLYREGLIDQDDALRYALDATEMARLLEELV